MQRERGFTLIEIVVGAAVAAVLGWTLLALCSRTIASAEALDRRLNASAGAAHAVERMTSEASSALAVYVPSSDVSGNSNSDGHEVDYYAQDASHRPYVWTYTYSAAAQTLTRYSVVPGASPAAGESVSNIDGFSVQTQPASALSNPASPVYDPLFSGTHATDVLYPFPPNAAALGGNGLVVLQITASGVNERAFLASADAPTQFTVTIVYTPSPVPVATATPSPIPWN